MTTAGPTYAEQRAQTIALFAQHCNCATAPDHPTMPTARTDHLPSCPVAAGQAMVALLDKAIGSLMHARQYTDDLRVALVADR